MYYLTITKKNILLVLGAQAGGKLERSKLGEHFNLSSNRHVRRMALLLCTLVSKGKIKNTGGSKDQPETMVLVQKVPAATDE